MNVKDSIKKIKLLVLDVDGVLTDGKIILDSKGGETKVFDVQDGYGLVVLRKAGIKTAILTARSSVVVRHRARDLKIDKVYQDAFPKIVFYKKLLRNFKLKDEEVCFIGDDWPDIEVLRRVGFAVSVPNAVQEVKQVAHYVTKHKGGAGAVREVIEMILKTQGFWPAIIMG